MFAIARKELLSLFLSPLAWVILGVVQGLMAYLFSRLLQGFAQTQGQLQAISGAPGVTRLVAAPLFEITAFVWLLMITIITMRLIAEERRAGTFSLLLNAPLPSSAIVLGKFLGAYIFVLCTVALTLAMPASLQLEAALDLGLMASGIIALALLAAAFTAAGLYMSTLTAQPMIAAISTFGLLLLTWLIDAGLAPDGLLAYASILNHFRNLLRGILDTKDVIYFVLLTLTFLILAVRRIDAERSPL